MYIKKIKDLIKAVFQDYQNEAYISQHNDMVLNKIWPAFLSIAKVYMVIGGIYAIAYNSVDYYAFNNGRETTYFYILLGAMPLFIFTMNRVCQKLKEKSKLNFIFLTFLLTETAFQLFLTEVFISVEDDSQTLAICQLYINLLLILAIIRSLYVRVLIIVKFYIYFIIRQIFFQFYELQTLHIVFFIILLLYFWDQQLIILSKMTQFADHTLKSIPSAVCVLDYKCENVLFSNNFLDQLIDKLNQGNLTATKSINNMNHQLKQFPSLETIITSDQKILSLLQNLYISKEDFKLQNDENNQIVQPKNEILYSEDDINLAHILVYLSNIKQSNNDQIYCYKFYFDDQNQDADCPTVIEVRFRIKMQFGLNKNTMLLNFLNHTANIRSGYYKNMNVFKSQVIRSISHELRTRLNVIQGFIQIIQYNSSVFDQDTRQLLRAIYNNCRIQDFIISSIINYNLIRENKLIVKSEKCKLINVVQEVVDLFQEEAQLKQIKLTFENDFISNTQELDQEKFQSILIHIISNALKFNKQNSFINVRLKKDNQQNQQYPIKESLERTKNQSILQCSALKSVQDPDSSSSYHFPLRKITNFKYVNPNSQFTNGIHQLTNTFYDQYLIEVKDGGIGMSQSKLDVVQNLLQSGDEIFEIRSGDSASGMMLGLRAANSLIKYLNGQKDDNCSIQINSIEDKGTTVQIRIRCKVMANTEGLGGSDLLNREQSQIENEAGILEFNDFYHKHSPFSTDPDLVSQQKLFNKKHKTSSSKNLNILNTSIAHNKRSSINVFSSFNTSSHYKYGTGSKNHVNSPNLCSCEQKIVIVDDEPYNLVVLDALLGQLGYCCIKANNGLQCLTTIEKCMSQFEDHKCKGFKAIIMDYQMPIMNGEQATKQLQILFKENARINIPIFGLTGFSGEDELLRLLEAGMKEVYVKPINLKTLEEMIGNLNQGEYNQTSRLSSKQFLQCIELEMLDECQQFE